MKRVKLLVLSFRGCMWLYFLPLIVVLGLAPVVSCFNISRYGVQNSLMAVTNFLQISIPVFSICWQVAILREYIEGEGNEVLFVYQSMGKTRLLDVVLVFLWYCAHIGITVAVLSRYTTFALLETTLYRLLIQSLVFTAMFYALSYLIRSVGMATMVVLGYYFMTAFYFQDNLFAYISVFQFPGDMTIPPMNAADMTAALTGIVFLIAGSLADRREMILDNMPNSEVFFC